jgi:hypothetical protein
MANLEFRNFPLGTSINTGDLVLLQCDPLGDKNYTGIKYGDFMKQNNVPRLYIGVGSPEGTITATSGSIYTDYNGPSIYIKLTGNGNIGWSV